MDHSGLVAETVQDAERMARNLWRDMLVKIDKASPEYRADVEHRIVAPKVWYMDDLGFLCSCFRSTDEQCKKLGATLASRYDPDAFEWERQGQWA